MGAQLVSIDAGGSKLANLMLDTIRECAPEWWGAITEDQKSRVRKAIDGWASCFVQMIFAGSDERERLASNMEIWSNAIRADMQTVMDLVKRSARRKAFGFGIKMLFVLTGL